MKILITGGSGLFGNNLATYLSQRYKVYATYLQHPVCLDGCHLMALDIRDAEQVDKKLSSISPDCIIHAAALTNVDYCEEHPEEAYNLNVMGTNNLIDVSESIGCKFVFISTDSVFDGKRGMYIEEDPVNPINTYARTKLEGEEMVKRSDLNYAILRTNIYGRNMQKKFSLAEWMLHNFREQKRVTLFSDVYFTPILVNNLSGVIEEVIEKDLSGLYHVGGSERCSKLEFGSLLAEIFGLDKRLIVPTSINEKNFIAKRPKDASLDSGKIKKNIKTELLNVKEGLEWFKKLVQ